MGRLFFANTDEHTHDKAHWEHTIAVRKEIVDDARASGDAEFIEKAEMRLDRAIDGYTRDCR